MRVLTGPIHTERAISVPAGPVALDARLAVPPGARAAVLVVQGAPGDRPPERLLARALRESGLATLTLDLLTPEEEGRSRAAGHERYAIARLSPRLAAALAVLRRQAALRGLPIGVWTTGTSAGAALRVAADPDAGLGGVLSLAGRPDLAHEALRHVRVPVLLLVPGADPAMLRWNQEAYARLAGPKELMILEAPAAQARINRLSRDWLVQTLAGGRA